MNTARPAPPTPQHPRNGKIYFLADAHLGGEPAATESGKVADLCALLEHLEGAAASLFLVGDVFDFWFEYPRITPTDHQEVLAALARLSAAGTEVRFLGGNHDYWAGGKLEAMTGATVHRQPIEVTLFDRRVFIAHGDGLPAGDLGYVLLKTVLRNRLAIGGFALIPRPVGRSLARWASGLTGITEERILRAIPPMEVFLQQTLDRGLDAAVVAHVHRPVVWRWKKGTGVIIGDWMVNRSVVELDRGGFRMLRWSGGALTDNERAAVPPVLRGGHDRSPLRP